jgi:hypothetical protein
MFKFLGKRIRKNKDELILHGAQSKLRAVLKTKLKTITPLCNQHNGWMFSIHLLILPKSVKWIEDEFAESRELAVAPSANKIKILYGYVVSSRAVINKLCIMHSACLLHI